jgi:hypothetical protein
MSHNKIALHKKGLINKPESGPINEAASVDNKIDMRHLEKTSPVEAGLLKKRCRHPAASSDYRSPAREGSNQKACGHPIKNKTPLEAEFCG